MDYGSQPDWTKWEYARTLAACLSYLILRQQDSVGLALLGPDSKTTVAPRSGRTHLASVLESLTQARLSSGAFSFSQALKEIGTTFRRRGLVIVLSDLLDEPERIIQSLKFFKYKKHEVIVFQVLDPQERRLELSGPIRFQALEDAQVLVTEPEAIAAEYHRIVQNFIDRYRVAFRNDGIDYWLFDTADPLERALGLYLTKRQQYV